MAFLSELIAFCLRVFPAPTTTVLAIFASDRCAVFAIIISVVGIEKQAALGVMLDLVARGYFSCIEINFIFHTTATD